jgi:hypothetical protein
MRFATTLFFVLALAGCDQAPTPVPPPKEPFIPTSNLSITVGKEDCNFSFSMTSSARTPHEAIHEAVQALVQYEKGLKPEKDAEGSKP